MRQRGLTNPPQRQRCDRNAKLRGGDVPIEIREADLDVARAAQPAARHLVDLAAPGSDEREFSRDEKAVEGDEGEDGDETGGRGSHGRSVDRLSGNESEQHLACNLMAPVTQALAAG